MKKKLFILLICLLLIVAACVREKESDNIVSVPTEIQNEIYHIEAYPIVKQNENEQYLSYPIDSNDEPADIQLPEKIIIPTPNSAKGVVIGKILSKINREPYIAPNLYLGAFISPNEKENNSPMLIGISPGVDPVAKQAQDGTFLFTDVSPGIYGLFIYTPVSIFPINDSKTGDYLMIIVKEGQLIDMGDIYLE